MSGASCHGGGTIGGKIGLGITFLVGWLIFDSVFDFLVGYCFSEGCGKVDAVVISAAALASFILAIPIGLLARIVINRMTTRPNN